MVERKVFIRAFSHPVVVGGWKLEVQNYTSGKRAQSYFSAVEMKMKGGGDFGSVDPVSQPNKNGPMVGCSRRFLGI